MSYTVEKFVKPHQFSVTARLTVGSRLAEVEAQQSALGFRGVIVGRGLTKTQANRLKHRVTQNLLAAGKIKVTRKPLS